MAIGSIKEAAAIYTLLRYVLPTLDKGEAEAPTSDQAKQAAKVLADSAHAKFKAGPMGHQVEDAWNCSYLVQAMEAQSIAASRRAAP